jgi:hypothetical protein
VQRAPHPSLRYPLGSRLPWLRAFVLEARRSDLIVSILKKGPARNKKAGGWKGRIELLLIIAGAIVVITGLLRGARIVSPPLS